MAGVTAAAFAAFAAPASAGDVWLWACHGPGGQTVREFSGHAEGPAAAACTTADPLHAASGQSWEFTAPSSTTITGVQLVHRAATLGAGRHYAARADNRLLEEAPPALADESPVFGDVARAGALTLGVDCANAPCTEPGAVDVSAVALRVLDIHAPTATGISAAGQVINFVGRTPQPFKIGVGGADDGLGLWSAAATMDGAAAAGRFAEASCSDLSADPARLDVPLGDVPGAQVANGEADPPAPGCPEHGTVALELDVSRLSDGHHTLRVAVTDLAGNVSQGLTKDIEVFNHVNLGSDHADLTIGTSVADQQGGQPGGGSSGGVAGATKTACRSPKLSMVLARKPLRVKRGVPILKSGKRYGFVGRLTCVIDGKRKSAPKRTRIALLNKVGRHTATKKGARVGSKGRIRFVLSYRGSRTLIFRFTNSDGRRSQVKIKIRIAKR